MKLENRKKNQNLSIGGISLGSESPIRIQTMTNTPTSDIQATVNQCIELSEAGSELIRITVPTIKEIAALQKIKARLRAEGIQTPIVADVHYFPEVAIAAAEIVEKVRVNPGNFVDTRQFKQITLTEEEYLNSLEKMALRAHPLFENCQKNETTIRVGVNHGSLCDRIVSRYGNTPLAMAMSAMEWIDICEKEHFNRLIFSLKSSNVKTMIEANLLLYKLMEERGSIYPLHLGVTEAANEIEGRVKSAVGIGALLTHGLGDTIRVSLTETPKNEIIFAKHFLEAIHQFNEQDFCFKEGILTINSEEKNQEKWWGISAAAAGYYYLENRLKDIIIHNSNFSKEDNLALQNAILQACRIKMSKTEIIACPSCGRTQYNIQEVLHKVRERFSDYPNLKIAVMGCVVNGPGEMADADFGVIGSRNGKIGVYQMGKRVSPFLPMQEGLDYLEKIISKECQKR